jgi:hypothetical protein
VLIETILICAITIIPPYYDCSEDWMIFIFDEVPLDECSGYLSCAKWYPKRIYIGMNQTDWVGQCGHKTLMHELNHLIYLDESYCH